MRFPEPEDPRARYGRDPDPWNRDEEWMDVWGPRGWRRVPLHPSVADSPSVEDARRDVEESG